MDFPVQRLVRSNALIKLVAQFVMLHAEKMKTNAVLNRCSSDNREPNNWFSREMMRTQTLPPRSPSKLKSASDRKWHCKHRGSSHACELQNRSSSQQKLRKSRKKLTKAGTTDAFSKSSENARFWRSCQ